MMVGGLGTKARFQSSPGLPLSSPFPPSGPPAICLQRQVQLWKYSIWAREQQRSPGKPESVGQISQISGKEDLGKTTAYSHL